SDTYDTIGMTAILSTWYAQMSISSAADSARMQLYAHGLYGQGQIVGVDDTGLDWDNVYFRDPAQSIYYDKDNDTICESPNLLHRKVIAYNPFIDTFDLNNSGHGTHTSGSVLADSLGSNIPNDTLFARGMGMAPAAKLAFFDLQNSSGSFFTPTNLSLIYVWAYNAGARITSSSWGVGTGGSSSYTSRSQQLDRIAWDHKDLLMFRSAGNDNNESPPDSVNTPATAKNIVTVGATESGFGYGSTSWINPGTNSGNELIDVAEFSSHGPTIEGQLKPEILAPGGWYIWSADSDGNLSTNNNGITYMGGTSMSCPTAAGFAAIVRQYFSKGWYPSGIENAGDSLYPSAALIKAMMINSTRNSPGRYSIDRLDYAGYQNAPSFGQGWGRITLADAIYFDGDTRDLEIYDIAPGFSNSGEYNEYTFKTGASTDEYTKIVLTYTDYPAGVSPTTVVVNDLNLTVIEGSNTYFGNVFGTDTRSITGGLYDDKNVTEVVWLDATPNSYITVRIDAEAINNGPQPYALVITGDIDKTGSSPGIYYYNN
ncbi:S8 family serine peptidase, partial [candidate division WOR-3 bacterium]|nr:S8 family serine peptidase [candidate division WOR-3 bacterium]